MDELKKLDKLKKWLDEARKKAEEKMEIKEGDIIKIIGVNAPDFGDYLYLDYIAKVKNVRHNYISFIIMLKEEIRDMKGWNFDSIETEGVLEKNETEAAYVIRKLNKKERFLYNIKKDNEIFVNKKENKIKQLEYDKVVCIKTLEKIDSDLEKLMERI